MERPNYHDEEGDRVDWIIPPDGVVDATGEEEADTVGSDEFKGMAMNPSA